MYTVTNQTQRVLIHDCTNHRDAVESGILPAWADDLVDQLAWLMDAPFGITIYGNNVVKVYTDSPHCYVFVMWIDRKWVVFH